MKQQSRRRPFRNVAIGVGVYMLVLLLSMYMPNPFAAGMRAIAETGGWDADQITMRQGSYGFRFLYAVAEVEAWVTTDSGRFPVRVELTKVTPFGWTVQLYERGAPVA